MKKKPIYVGLDVHKDTITIAIAEGRLPLHEVLRCRLRYFSDGAVLGGQAFVQKHLNTYQDLTGRRNRTAPRPIPRVTDWGDLNTLRGLRKGAFG